MIELLVSDFDGTLVPFGDPDPATVDRFRSLWERRAGDCRFVVNSGRMIDDLAASVARSRLPAPDFLIGGVGTQLCDADCQTLPGWAAYIGEAFDIGLVAEVISRHSDIRPQEDAHQSRFKSSWYWYDQPPGAIDDLEEELRDRGVAVTVIYSSQRDLDVIPERADKGNALRFLCRFLELEHDRVVVAGDTGNDARMFTVDGVSGIVVANAHDDLRQVAHGSGNRMHISRQQDLRGVIDGLQRFGVLPDDRHPQADGPEGTTV